MMANISSSSCFNSCFQAIFFILLIYSIIISPSSCSPYYSLSDNQLTTEMLSAYSNSIDKVMRHNRKINNRTCIKRNGRCDLRPGGCCSNTTCRCNFLGVNCSCKKRGIFKLIGKRNEIMDLKYP